MSILHLEMQRSVTCFLQLPSTTHSIDFRNSSSLALRLWVMELKELIHRFRNGFEFTHPNPPSPSSEPAPRIASWNVAQAKRLYHALPPNCIRLVELEPADKRDAPIVLHTEGRCSPSYFSPFQVVLGRLRHYFLLRHLISSSHNLLSS